MHFSERVSSMHRGDYMNARKAIMVANAELTALEPRAISAHELGQIPPATLVGLVKARLFVARTERLMLEALDVQLADCSKWLASYADSTFIPLDEIAS